MKTLMLSLALFSALMLLSDRGTAQRSKDSAAGTPSILSLTRADNGRRRTAYLGETIQVDLETIAPSGYGLPQISDPNIIYENSVLRWPPSPAGPLPIYMFEAISAGQAQIRFLSERNPPLEFTVEVRPVTKRPGSALPDQANTAMRTDAWTNLVNPLRQDFIPSVPKLTSVEVELVVANPGPPDETVQMMLLDSAGNGLLLAEKTVSAEDCEHVSFLLPAGFEVQPGKVYGIELRGGESNLFGWKYVIGGYEEGDGWFAGKPLVKGGRATFLFRTFGTK